MSEDTPSVYIPAFEKYAKEDTEDYIIMIESFKQGINYIRSDGSFVREGFVGEERARLLQMAKDRYKNIKGEDKNAWEARLEKLRAKNDA